jgi:cell division protease FtsH
VDDEIARMVAERYDYVLKRLRGERGLLDTIAVRLLELETLDQAEFNRLLGGGAATEVETERAEERKPEVAG